MMREKDKLFMEHAYDAYVITLNEYKIVAMERYTKIFILQ